MAPERLTKARLFAWRAAGKTAIVLTIPFYAIIMASDWLSKGVSVLCALAVMPNVAFYDWCVKRHNALAERRRTLKEQGR